jgi:hypothetical protein
VHCSLELEAEGSALWRASPTKVGNVPLPRLTSSRLLFRAKDTDSGLSPMSSDGIPRARTGADQSTITSENITMEKLSPPTTKTHSEHRHLLKPDQMQNAATREISSDASNSMSLGPEDSTSQQTLGLVERVRVISSSPRSFDCHHLDTGCARRQTFTEMDTRTQSQYHSRLACYVSA